MNVEKLCAHITNFGFDLVGAELALDANPHIAKEISGNRKSLIWVRDQRAPLMIANPSTFDCYRSIIKTKDYSYLMSDGGVIQIALTYDGWRIEAHRFLYHPCPFLVTKAEVDEFGGGLLDFIDSTYMDDAKDNLLLRSPIRFDFAPDAATESHPASHLTLNGPDCRIPGACTAPIRNVHGVRASELLHGYGDVSGGLSTPAVPARRRRMPHPQRSEPHSPELGGHPAPAAVESKGTGGVEAPGSQVASSASRLILVPATAARTRAACRRRSPAALRRGSAGSCR